MLLIIDKSSGYDAARQSCKDLGGDLASPLSKTELAEIANYEPSGWITVWLGLKLVKKDQERWEWITGETLSADSDMWQDQSQSSRGDCAGLNLGVDHPNNGKLIRRDCQEHTCPYLICQFV